MSMGVTPRSPVQLLAALDSNHKEEIETMIRYTGIITFYFVFKWRFNN